MTDAPGDPTLIKRAQIAHLVSVGRRLGYSLFGIAIVAFGMGFVVGFDGAVRTIVVATIVVGSIVLAPAIVFGYGIKAAERDDRARGL